MGDDFKVDVLKQALKTQRSEAQQREEALQSQLNGLWQRAEKERKVLMGQVSELKNELARRGSPKTLLSDVTSKLTSEFKGLVTSKDVPASESNLWQLDPELEGGSPEEDAVAATHVGDPGGATSKYKIKTLEAKVQAQELEIKELREMVAERDAAVSRQQQRNGTLAAKIEERDQHVANLQAQIDQLEKRVRLVDAFAPPAWITGARSDRDRERGGEAALLQGASGKNNWHQDEDLIQGELVPGYSEFEERLCSPGAAPLVEMINSFRSAFLLKSPKISDFGMVHNFLGAMENPFRNHRAWKGASDEQLMETLDALEAMILRDPRVHACIFASMGSDWELRDAHFAKRLFLHQFIQPEHLDISRAFRAHPALALARSALRRLEEALSPQEALECVFRSARVIFRMLNEAAAASRANAASVDDFLPLLIYTVLKSQPPRMHRTLEYVSLFRFPKRFGGERQYYLVQLQTAVAFIDNLDAASLSMEAADFDAMLRQREAIWEAREAGAGSGEGEPRAEPPKDDDSL